MAARKRKSTESLKSYRSALKREEKISQHKLGPRLIYRLTNNIIGSKMVKGVSHPIFKPFRYSE